MRALFETETFESRLSKAEQNQIAYVLANSLALDNIGVIAPHQIEGELMQLKIKSKMGSIGIMNEAIAMYEGYNGRIRLFNLSNSSSGGRSPIPAYIPFSKVNARNRANSPGGTMNRSDLATSPAIFMNMHKIGNWDASNDHYIGVSPATDLYTMFESGYVMYKLIAEVDNLDRVLNNKKILNCLTNIYTFIFAKAAMKASKAVFSTDFMRTASEYTIATFFLKYVIGEASDDIVHDYAYSATNGKTSATSLKEFVRSADINYSSLSGFLNSYGLVFFDEEVGINAFQNAWLTTFGNGLLLAIEYLPFLIHFLLATVHGANLGGSNRLIMHKADLVKKGLDIFYRTLISEIR